MPCRLTNTGLRFEEMLCLPNHVYVEKVKVALETGHESPEEEQKYGSTFSLTSVLYGGGWLTPRPPEKETRYPFYRRVGLVWTGTENLASTEISFLSPLLVSLYFIRSFFLVLIVLHFVFCLHLQHTTFMPPAGLFLVCLLSLSLHFICTSLSLLYNTHIHAPGVIRTFNPSKRAATDLRLKPLGHWDRQIRSPDRQPRS